MPPNFGASPANAVTCAVPMIATRLATHSPDWIAISSSCSSVLFIEPDLRQVLINEVRRADFPALHIRTIRNYPVPPQHPDHVALFVEHVFLEPAHQRALLCRVGFVQNLFIEVDLSLVFELAIILRIDRGGQDLLDIEQRVDKAVAGSFENDIEITI